MKKKRLAINLMASTLAFVVQLLINFVLTPYISKTLGDAAYGFIGIANNFVSYATIITVALNSMAGRFISVEYNKGNTQKANKYFTSVFIADIILAFVMLVISGLVIINLNSIIDIPDILYTDVFITFALSFASMIMGIISTVFTVATFVKDRIDISSIINIISNLIRLIVLLLLFGLLMPKIYYIALCGIICNVYYITINIVVTKKILPELKITKIDFSMDSIKEIISSGVWNSVNSISRVLLTGVDLWIANVFISPIAAGVLAISKTIPNTIEGFLTTIANTFTPRFTILYSQDKKDELIKEIKLSMKLLSFIMAIPLAGIIIFGMDFFTLWLPHKTYVEVTQIQILSILALAPYVCSSFIYTLFTIDTVTNQLKRPVFASITIGVLTIITELILLNTTSGGVYIIAGVSSIYWIIKVCLFNPVNCACNLKIKWTTFYPGFIKSFACMLLILLVFGIVEQIVFINTWIDLIMVASICGMIGYILNYILLFSKDEKMIIKQLVYDKLRYMNK